MSINALTQSIEALEGEIRRLEAERKMIGDLITGHSMALAYFKKLLKEAEDNRPT